MKNNRENFQFSSQREIYKLVEKLLQTDEKEPKILLKELLNNITKSGLFPIDGARLWSMSLNQECYRLEYQIGNVQYVDEKCTIPFKDSKNIYDIAKIRTIVSKEENKEFLKNEVFLFCATGVGELVSTKFGKLYEYIIAVNADIIRDEFVQIFEIIGISATNSILKNNSYQERWKLKQDLEKAAELQKSLLPEHHFIFNSFDVYGISIQDREVGGDYFDYVSREDDSERASIVVSDVASKGMSAAIQALFVSGALRMGAKYQSKITKLISNLNELLCDTFPYEHFVSMFYCELSNTINGMILYVNAGHCPPIVYSKKENNLKMLMPTGGILGVKKDQRFSLESINLNEGDILVVVTDGVIDAQNEKGEAFGYDNIGKIIKNNYDRDTKELCSIIMEESIKHSLKGSYKDDATIVTIKRKEEKKSKEDYITSLK